MKRSNLNIGIAVALLLGAGAIVALKMVPEKTALDSEEAVVEQRSVRKPHTQPKSQPAKPSKWRSLADDAIPRHTRLQLAREIDRDLPKDDIDLLFASLRRGMRSWSRCARRA